MQNSHSVPVETTPILSRSRLRLVPILLAQGIGLACGLAGIRLNSHLVPPTVLGNYGLFLTFTPIGMWLVYVGLLKYVTRHWASTPDRRSLQRDVLAAWVRRLPWLALLVSIPALVMFRLAPVERLIVWLALFVSAALLALAAFVQVALQAERAHWRDCATAATGSLTRSFLPPLLYAFSRNFASMLLGFTVHALAYASAGLWALRASLKPNPPKAPANHATWQIYEGPFFTVLALANLILLGVNRWIVVWLFGEQEAGYFTLAGSTVTIVTSMLASVFIQYQQPDLFALGDRNLDNHRDLAKRVDAIALVYTICGLVGISLLSAIAPSLVGPLISPTYREALNWILPTGLYGLTLSLGLFYHTMLLAGRRERHCGPVDLITAALLIIGCLASALAGPVWLGRWLMASPAIPWLLTRAMARHYLFKPAASPAP